MLYYNISSQHLPQSYTPVNGLRELPMGAPEEPVDPPFPPVWDWALQYSSQRRARFTQPVSQPACPPPVLNGNLNTNLDRSWVRFICREDSVNSHISHCRNRDVVAQWLNVWAVNLKVVGLNPSRGNLNLTKGS